MEEKTIIITGGSGFLGVSTAKLLLEQNPSRQIILTDITEHPRMNSLQGKVDFVKADLSEKSECERIITKEVGSVFHFASLVSGGAEKDFNAGFKANITLTMNLLEVCKNQNTCPKFIFTSSIATFGGEKLPSTIDDWTHQHPQNSYGVAKVIGEQLLNDYSRKGYIDGRGVRLAAIIVRDEPNTAASGYASSIIREPVAGRDYICPVSENTALPLLSNKRAVELLVALNDLPPGALGDYRTINSPSISPTAKEMAEAVRNIIGIPLGKIDFEPDPKIMSIVATWPQIMKHDRAKALGLKADESIQVVINDYVNEFESILS